MDSATPMHCVNTLRQRVNGWIWDKDQSVDVRMCILVSYLSSILFSRHAPVFLLSRNIKIMMSYPKPIPSALLLPKESGSLMVVSPPTRLSYGTNFSAHLIKIFTFKIFGVSLCSVGRVGETIEQQGCLTMPLPAASSVPRKLFCIWQV